MITHLKLFALLPVDKTSRQYPCKTGKLQGMVGPSINGKMV
jgi:hypothetical protein